MAPRSRYLRQLFEIYPSGRRWPSPSWVLEGNLFRNLQTTIQVLPSQRAATTKTKELPEKESTVYSAKLIHCLYKGTVLHCVSVLLHHRCGGLYTCALYIFRFWSLSPLLRRSSFRVQICGESTLGLNLRDLSVFFSFLEFLFEQCIISWPNAL